MRHGFCENTAPNDEALVRSAQGGDRAALNLLFDAHQGWIYNLAVRMLWNTDDAADCTQEILLQAMTHLPSFQHQSLFRTWLYRVAANHILMWKRKSRAEAGITGFDCYGACLSSMRDVENPVSSPDEALLVRELEIGCMSGMLLCLSREQRIAYVLGEIFEMGAPFCAEILEISEENFRQRLSRARKDLHEFLKGNCGLADPKNKCRCKKKTSEFVRMGIVDPHRLQFAPHAVRAAEEGAEGGSRMLLGMMENGFGALYRSHPKLPCPDFVSRLKDAFSDSRFREMLNL